MSQLTLEQRVTELERLVARLWAKSENNGPVAEKDWRSTIGMFANDPIWEQIVEEGRKYARRTGSEPFVAAQDQSAPGTQRQRRYNSFGSAKRKPPARRKYALKIVTGKAGLDIGEDRRRNSKPP